MSKIKIKTIVNEEVLETVGLLNNNIIIYNDKDVQVKISIGDIFYIIRESSEFKLKLDFSNNLVFYELKNYHQTLELKIDKKLLQISNNKINLEYAISNNLVNFQLEYEEII